MLTRRRAPVGVLALVAIVVGCGATSTPVDPATRANQLLAGIHLTPAASNVRLVATTAVSDLGVQGGIRTVRVRIVDELAVDVRVEAEEAVVFAEPPRFCLVGPFSAPDDAGLTDPCWGDPDFAALVLAKLPADPNGRPMLAAHQPLSIAATLRRGDTRCDYPPGAWVVEIKANPLVAGSPAGARYLPDVPFDVPFATTGPLPLLLDTRYCGLASVIVRDQGEPAVQSP